MITDEELLLYYYRDGLEPSERARIGAALAAQPQLAQRLHRLVARLDAVAATEDVALPVGVRQRWLAALDGAAARGSGVAPRARRFRQTRWLAAAATLAAIAWVVIFQAAAPPARIAGEHGEPSVAGSVERPASAYENGLRFHLASTERRLASLGRATPEERTKLLEAIIGQNRLYALAAERAGEPQLARVLRAFTPVLEDAVRGEGESRAASLARLNFELRVMQARLGGDAQPPANTL